MRFMQMDYDTWDWTYRPVLSRHDNLLIQDLSEPEIRKASAAKRLWTVVEGDANESWYIVEGKRIVNRVGYVISERPYENNVGFEVPIPFE